MSDEVKMPSSRQQILVFFLGLSILYLSALLFSPDNLSFYRVSPHPYFIVSCTLAIYYGLTFAFNFSFVSSCMYLGLLHSQIDYQEVSTIIDFEYLTFPVLIIVVSCFFGEIRTRFITRLTTISAHDHEVDDSNQLLIDKMVALQDENYKLKKQLVNKLQTFQNVLDSTRGFQSLNELELVFFYFDTLNRELEISRAVVYLVDQPKNLLIPIKKIGMENTTTISIVESNDLLIEESLATGNIASVGELETKKLDNLSEDDSLITIPINTLGDSKYIISIHQLPFLNYSPSNLELIKILSEWLQISLDKSFHFNGLVTNSIFNDKFEIYTFNYLKEKIEENFLLKQRYDHKCQLFEFNLFNLPLSDVDSSEKLLKIFIGELKSLIRTTDTLCLGHSSEKVYIVFPYLKQEDSQGMASQLNDIQNTYKESGKLAANLAFKIRSLNFDDYETFENLLGDLNA